MTGDLDQPTTTIALTITITITITIRLQGVAKLGHQRACVVFAEVLTAAQFANVLQPSAVRR